MIALDTKYCVRVEWTGIKPLNPVYICNDEKELQATLAYLKIPGMVSSCLPLNIKV
jgi:hypothetical protein